MGTAIMKDTEKDIRARAEAFKESEDGKRVLNAMNQYQRGVKRAQDYEHILEKLESEVGGISAVRFDRERVDSTPDVHAGIENDSCRLVAMQEKRDSLYADLAVLKEQLTELIDEYVTDDIDNMCVKCHFLDGMSYETLGEIRGLHKTTVRTHVLNALIDVILPDDMIVLNF